MTHISHDNFQLITIFYYSYLQNCFARITRFYQILFFMTRFSIFIALQNRNEDEARVTGEDQLQEINMLSLSVHDNKMTIWLNTLKYAVAWALFPGLYQYAYDYFKYYIKLDEYNTSRQLILYENLYKIEEKESDISFSLFHFAMYLFKRRIIYYFIHIRRKIKNILACAFLTTDIIFKFHMQYNKFIHIKCKV